MSTPTTSLLLQEINTGDQSGTWGISVNTNMQLIDDSIAGVANITFNGSNNYTLSVINYATDESRKMVIIANGTPGSFNQIVAPLVTKFYVVVNRTNTAITIGATTGTTVTIPYTATPSAMVVYCDGTDFKPASNSISGTFTADIFSGSGIGLTGTATSLSIGGNAATATSATTSTNLANGTAGAIAYQSGSGATSFLNLGTNTYLLSAGATAPQYISQSSLTVGSATTATNVAGGAAGSLVYQTGSGATSTLGLGTTNYVLTAGASAPQYVAQSTLSVGTAATANALNSSNSYSGVNFTASGYFSGPGTNLTGTASGLSIGGNAATATRATNVAGGASGSVLYQTSVNTTGALAIGTNGQVLTVSSGSLAWQTPSSSVTTATNLAGGAINQIPYQTGAGATSFITAPSSGVTYLSWNGSAFAWASTGSTVITNSVTFNNGGAGAASGTAFNNSANVTVSYNTIGASPAAGSSSINTVGTITSGVWQGSTIQPAYIATLNQNTTGTAANITATSNTTLTSIPNLITVGTITTGTWQGSVIQPTYIATLNQNTTGNAASATASSNILGGAANCIPYQTGASTTSFIVAPTTASTALTWNGSAYVWGSTGGPVAGGVVYENGQTISSNYTMTSGNNGMSAGPITVATGVTVTIPSGSAWSIV